MGFILRSHRDRYRQKARENFYRTFAVLACFIAAVVIGYVGGQKKYAQEMRQLRQHADELQEQTAKAEKSAMDMQTNYQTLSVQYTQLQGNYKRDVPQGDLGLLTSLVREQLDKGLAVERMAQIIRAAQPPQNCSAPINKRLIVSTPSYKGPNSAITFADGLITLKSTGEPSINNKQEQEAWFDPGKPVTVNFTIIGGKNEDKTGLLPLHHTIILKGKEYRFTISEGPHSFIVITSDNCDYPEALTGY
jgi:hypothetical protein